MTVFLLYLAVIVGPVRSVFLQEVGGYSNQIGLYQLSEPKLRHAFEAAGISTEPRGETVWVNAYVRYRFGGTILLCLDPFESARATVADIEEAKRETGLSPALVAGHHCVPVRSEEVREVKGAMPTG